ncbi:MAG: hypothetical protein ACTSQF_01865 [Candidatus Heimdallarchaeaceae archaeon]
MDLTLSLSYQEQNDNKALVLTDTSDWNQSGSTFGTGTSLEVDVMYEVVFDGGNSTFTTAGSDSDAAGSRFISTGTGTLAGTDQAKEVTPLITEITAATLDTTVTDTSYEESAKSQVDLVAEFGDGVVPEFEESADLVYTITALLLGDTTDTELIDGLYDIAYNISITPENSAVETAVTELDVIILVYGQVKVLVYDKLRTIPATYLCNNDTTSKEILEADLAAAYLSSIETSAYTAKQEELLGMLSTLNNLVVNGSNLTW